MCSMNSAACSPSGCKRVVNLLWLYRNPIPARRKLARTAVLMQTILVIDDDENLRDTISVLLEREGFRAILAPNGKSGLD